MLFKEIRMQINAGRIGCGFELRGSNERQMFLRCVGEVQAVRGENDFKTACRRLETRDLRPKNRKLGRPAVDEMQKIQITCDEFMRFVADESFLTDNFKTSIFPNNLPGGLISFFILKIRYRL